jgi:hypothetical protein
MYYEILDRGSFWVVCLSEASQKLIFGSRTVSSFTETNFRYYDLLEVGLAGVPRSATTEAWLQNVQIRALYTYNSMRNREAFISCISGLFGAQLLQYEFIDISSFWQFDVCIVVGCLHSSCASIAPFRYYDLLEVGLAGVPQSTPTQDWLQNVQIHIFCKENLTRN